MLMGLWIYEFQHFSKCFPHMKFYFSVKNRAAVQS